MGILQDLRFAVRMLLRRRAFTLVVVLTLAIGIGASSSMFSAIHALLVRPLDLPELDRMAIIQASRAGQPFYNGLSPGNLLDLRRDAPSFESLAAVQFWETPLTGGGDPEQIVAVQVGEGFFDMMGVQPLLGRWFARDEVDGQNENVVILSYGLWNRRYARDSTIVGRSINLAGGSYTVVGVMPPGFRFPNAAELWAPITLTPKQRQDHRSTYLLGVAKLRPGVTLAEGDAQVRQLGQRYAASFPELSTTRLRLVSLVHALGEDTTRTFIFVLFGAALFVLLIACANVANVFLAYALARRKELAVRTALGAGRRRIVRQLLTEAMLLGVIAGGAALLFASWAVDLIKGAMPPAIVRFISGWDKMGVDPAVLGFAVAVGLLVGVVFGLVPALQVSRTDVNAVLKDEARSTTGTGHTHRLRNGLVVGQVALALILLIGAAALTRGFVNLTDARSRGIDPSHVLTMQVQLPHAREATPKATIQSFAGRVLERLRGLPQVSTAAIVNIIPWANDGNTRVAYPEGRMVRPAEEISVDYRPATPGYLELLPIPLLEGRTLAERDADGAPLVAVVSAGAAHELWPGMSPIGKRFRWSQTADAAWVTVVGVVGDVQDRANELGPRPAIYTSFEQAPTSSMFLVLRTEGPPFALARAAQAAVFAVSPSQPVTQVRTMPMVVSERFSANRIASALMIAFALLALVLAAVGVYGVVATLVTQRTHEIGVRMALGAQRHDVIRLVIGKGLLLTSIGIGLGLAGGAALLRLLGSLLPPTMFQGSAWLYLVLPLPVAACAVLGSLMPALRASKLDPLVALRHD
jgi:putative ABC transport system permease protein